MKVIKESFLKYIKLFYPLEILKNSLQYLFGAIIFLIYNNFLNVQNLIISLLSFILTYNFVYYLNDLLDYKSDRKRIDKVKTSPLHLKEFDRERLILFYLGLFLAGIFTSIFTNLQFLIILITLIFLNILHQTKLFKQTNTLLLFNMFIIQNLKFVSGWIAQNPYSLNIPLWLFISASFLYITFYKLYKQIFGREKKNYRIIFILSAFSLLSIFSSLILYEIFIPMIITLLASSILVFIYKRLSDMVSKKIFGALSVTLTMLLFIVLIFLFKTNVILLKINEDAQKFIENYKSIEELKDKIRKVSTIEDIKKLVCEA